MKTMRITLIICLSLLLILPPSIDQAAADEQDKVLILYDSLAKGTSKEGNVEALQRLLAAFGVSVTLGSIDTFQPGALQQYKKVIGVHNASDIAVANLDYLAELAAYEGNYLHIGMDIPAKLQKELSLRIEADAYIPDFEKGNLSEMAYLLKDWLGVAKQGKIYLVFKEIYPFSDLKLLEMLADKLYDAGIPFIVSIRPVFYNTDYPAMKRYLASLKYVQSRNGSIMVNAPVVASTITQLDRELKAQMESFIDVLADYEIAPLGMGAEMYWIYDQQYAVDGMKFFDSVVLFPNERIMHKSKADTSPSFATSMYSLSLSQLQEIKSTRAVMESFPMNTAVTYDFFENEAELEEAVQALLSSWILFADYKHTPHAVHTELNEISSSDGQLYINGHRLALNSAMTPIDSEYEYKEQVEKSFEQWFNVQNKIFIIVILVTLLAFGGFFIIGYRLYRRKYYK